MLLIWIGRECCFWKYIEFHYFKLIYDFSFSFVKDHDINFQECKNHSIYHRCTTHYANYLIGNGFEYLTTSSSWMTFLVWWMNNIKNNVHYQVTWNNITLNNDVSFNMGFDPFRVKQS